MNRINVLNNSLIAIQRNRPNKIVCLLKNLHYLDQGHWQGNGRSYFWWDGRSCYILLNIKIMKKILIKALILNIVSLIFSVIIFITKGIMEEIIHWKFFASLSGVIFFGISVYLIIRQLKRS